MNTPPIQNILIIGAGTMGHQIGYLCARHGYAVCLYDLDETMLETGMSRIQAMAQSQVKKGELSQSQAKQALERIQPHTDPQAAGENADLVSESVPEDPALKGRIFAQFHGICPLHAVFTTNTSSLLPSMFAQATGRPERFLAFHFHDIAVTRIVDIMPHPQTAQATVTAVERFALSLDQVPIVLKKEQPGYLFNTLLMNLLDSALSLAANDVAPIEDIDRAWMGIMHTALGPFGIMDSVGLDTVWNICAYWAEQRNDPKALKNAAFLKRFVEAGRLGQKCGQGFYRYPGPAFARPEFLAPKAN